MQMYQVREDDSPNQESNITFLRIYVILIEKH